MNNAIRVYTSEWDDASYIQKFLNSHLLKFSVEDISILLFEKLRKKLPIVQIGEKFYSRPSINLLKSVLNIYKESTFNYHSNIIVGGGLEALFALDYSLKHNIDSVCFSSSDKVQLELFNKAYSSILKFPNYSLANYVYDSYPQNIVITSNRSYYKVILPDAEIYTKSILIVPDVYESPFLLEKDNIFHGIDELMVEVRKDRIRNKRMRTFFITGEGEDILIKARELYNEISQWDENINFKIFIVSPLNFRFQDKLLLGFLRATGNVKIIGQTKILDITKEGFLYYVRTDLMTYEADYILEVNKKYTDLTFVKNLLDVDLGGIIPVDYTYKTKLPNIYVLNQEEIDVTPDNRSLLLDKYLKSAGVMNALVHYLKYH